MFRKKIPLIKIKIPRRDKLKEQYLNRFREDILEGLKEEIRVGKYYYETTYEIPTELKIELEKLGYIVTPKKDYIRISLY